MLQWQTAADKNFRRGIQTATIWLINRGATNIERPHVKRIND